MNNDKFVLIPVDLLKNIKDLIKGSQYEDEVKKILESREVIESQDVTKLPKEGHVKRVIDGDTVELQNGLILRYVGITAPETGENFYKESTGENRKLVEDKKIRLEYDNYKSDKFGRILAYPILPDGTNVSIELVKKGLAELVIYQKRKAFVYQKELLKAQTEAKNKGIGIWSNIR